VWRLCGTIFARAFADFNNASLFLNRDGQGSITGAYSSLTKNVTPSFVLLAVQGPKVVCYVYELVNGDVEVSKTEFTKKESS
jgi:hypothetical protein